MNLAAIARRREIMLAENADGETEANFAEELASQALAAGQFPSARRLFSTCLARDSECVQAHRGLARVYLHWNQLHCAVFHLRRATEIDPSNARSYLNLGASYLGIGQLANAAEALRRSLVLDQACAEAHYNLALAYRRQGNDELAISEYLKAIHHNPCFAWAHFNLANVYSSKGYADEADRHYKQSLDLDPPCEKPRNSLLPVEVDGGQ
jgi:Tfp pilus assembly protein PilF